MFAVGGGERSATTSERLVVLECLPTTLQVLFGLILDDGPLGSNALVCIRGLLVQVDSLLYQNPCPLFVRFGDRFRSIQPDRGLSRTMWGVGGKTCVYRQIIE